MLYRVLSSMQCRLPTRVVEILNRVTSTYSISTSCVIIGTGSVDDALIASIRIMISVRVIST